MVDIIEKLKKDIQTELLSKPCAVYTGNNKQLKDKFEKFEKNNRSEILNKLNLELTE